MSNSAKRRLLYGCALVVIGMIVIILGPPLRTERPPEPHPEDRIIITVGLSLAAAGAVLLLTLAFRRRS